MLSESELRLLSEMSSEPLQHGGLDGLAERLDWSVGHTSRVVSRLEEHELIQTDREANRKIIRLANVQPTEQFSTLVRRFPHVDFSNLVSGPTLRILYYLNTNRTASELAELSGVSSSAVYRRLDELQHVGIVGKDHSRYALTEPFTPLSEFARSVAHHDHRHEAAQLATNAYLIWESHDEYLFGCQSEITDDLYFQTGPGVFERYGIALFTREKTHYFRTDRLSEVTPADLVCHTLLIDDSPRYRTYCLLLIAGQGITESSLKDRASHYDIDSEFDLYDIIREFYAYIESEGDVSGDVLPEWKDFKETAADYNISV